MQADIKGKQLLLMKEHEMTVSARGESLEDVAGKIFQIMRRQIFKEIDRPIIHLEAKEVYFEDVEVKKTTEKFMLFFWPKEKREYKVTAKVIVEVKYLDVTKEDF